MKQGLELEAHYPGIHIIHQKVRGKTKGDHNHDEHEIFLPLQGEISIKTPHGLFTAPPGKMIYIPPHQEHSFHSSSSNQGERLILIMDHHQWTKLGGQEHGLKVTATSQLAKEILFHLLIHPKSKATKSLWETLILTIDEMLQSEETLSLLHLTAKVRDERVGEALNIIQTSFAQELKMDELSRRSGMSLRTLNRLFVEELGVSPKEVVTTLRMEEAKKLLKHKSMSVTDVALAVGYQSLSQFITTFRKRTGLLPSDYL